MEAAAICDLAFDRSGASLGCHCTQDSRQILYANNCQILYANNCSWPCIAVSRGGGIGGHGERSRAPEWVLRGGGWSPTIYHPKNLFFIKFIKFRKFRMAFQNQISEKVC